MYIDILFKVLQGACVIQAIIKHKKAELSVPPNSWYSSGSGEIPLPHGIIELSQ